MAVYSGFFNALEGTTDRVYGAEDISKLFDGIITDGVYSTVGDVFFVTAFGGMNIKVGTGRCWFNHTWTVNDAPEIMELSEAPLIMQRIDAVIIEVNTSEAVRENSIKVITGIASDTPERPTLINEGDIHQYPLAYVLVDAGATEITQENITNMVGTEDCPFVVGILKSIDISDLLIQWEAEFNSALTEYEETNQQAFEEWFANLQYVLDGDVAGHLQNEIDSINAYLDSIGRAEEEEY